MFIVDVGVVFYFERSRERERRVDGNGLVEGDFCGGIGCILVYSERSVNVCFVCCFILFI